ncbi:MAG: PIG-L family deacetylase [Chitinophagaceae bacterium]|nr:PIG-L family deacetylase [Chitinophagaceae bacterium]
MKKLVIAFLIFNFSLLIVNAQPPKSCTSSEILLQLKKLNVLGSVLYVAAHPDDENTRMLAYLANEKLYRTGYMSMTRGDGGQNLIGDELGVDLGLIRTQELLSARRIDGAEQFFSRAFDFGYSKSPEETMKTWGHDKILSDVVWVIRKFRPDVIITRFPTTGEGGHGHHTASAILAGEAFDAAADPARFPEQLNQGVTVWQAKRLLWNTFNFGGNNTQSDDQFKLDCGEYNAILGKSYGEIAAASRSQHKSQGFGVPSQRGAVIEYLKTIKGNTLVNDLMDDVSIGWNRANEPAFEKIVNRIIEKFDVAAPEKSVADLVNLYKKVELMQDDFWKREKLNAIKDILKNCSGLYMEATTKTPFAVRGDSLTINLLVNNRSGAKIFNADTHVNNDYVIFDQLKKNENSVKDYTMLIRNNVKLTQPYWLENPMEKGSFSVTDQQQIGKGQSDPFSVIFSMLIEGKEFTFTEPVQYKHTDPVKGELFQPLCIVEPFSVSSIPVLAVNGGTNEWEIKSWKSNNLFNTYTKTASGSFLPLMQDKLLEKDQSIKIQGAYKTSAVPGNATELQPGIYREMLYQSNGKPYLELKQIQYDHIPAISYTKPVAFTSINFDLKTAGKLVGYIPGAGDKVPEALQVMGYKVVMLTEADILATNLKQFDAVITGVRTYNTNAWMNNVYEELMKYVKDGGVLLVQYNTSNRIGPVVAKIAPYPFNISRDRVTDEEAKVSFLIPDHPALNYPNKITAKDFDGWIQERSIYQADKADPAYKHILSMKDPGEKENDGSLIVADYGKGRFVYTGLVFFRELPAGVPGAYRLFANLIATAPASSSKEATLKDAGK